MSKFYFLFFIVFTTSIAAQHTSVTHEDFNTDGIEDRLKCTYEIGSNFGGGDCELVDGKTQNKFTLSNYGCFCAIKKRVFVAPDLRKKENEYFLYTLKKEILPQFRPVPDQSLYWIIKSGLNTQKPIENAYFDLVFNPETAWRHGEPELPYTYSIEIGAETLSKIAPEEKSLFTQSISSDHKDFLVYYGDTHFTVENEEIKDFISVANSDTYEILKTAHGVIAKKEDTYKWMFVTDMDINASPQKLRWASIEKVVLHDKHLIIKQSLAPDPEYNLYVVDIESGLGGRLKIDFDKLLESGIEIPDLSKEERFSIQEGNIIIGRKGSELKIPLEKIKQELTSFTKGK